MRRRSAPSGEIEYAAWLNAELLLVAAWCTADPDPRSMATIVRADQVQSVDVRCLTSVALASSRPGSPPTRLFTVCIRDRDTRADDLGTLVLDVGGRGAARVSAHLADALTDLATLLRDTVTPLDAATRELVMRFLVGAAGDHNAATNRELCEHLFQAREALRERLPASVIDGRNRLAIHVEQVLAVDDNWFYVEGWLHDADGAVTNLAAVSPEGSRVELLPRLYRFARPDVEEVFVASNGPAERSKGFISYFQLDAPSLLDRGWKLEVSTGREGGAECDAPAVLRGTDTVRTYVLAGLARERLTEDELKVNHIRPAVGRLQARHRGDVTIRDVQDYGRGPRSPAVSIIVPLYSRIDFLRHQLAHFVHDPEVRDADLVYVLDSPELADQLADLADELDYLYRVPFRVVTLTRNGGFALANNFGASVARGRRLLLLNSDVIPAAPGWLGRLSTFHDSTPRIGALGPKLLFDDDSLQHAGLYFDRDQGVWYNRHFFKGLNRSLPQANVARPVPAVSAACLLVERELYDRVGGLSGVYVQGDYEDSDFCLRLLDEGRENWYLPEVELYHLEGQSYPSPLRKLNADYNRWLHHQLWHEQMQAAMARYGSPVSP